MNKLIFFALPFLTIVGGCTQESESSEQMTLQVQKEQAMIDKGVQSMRIRSFYVADVQDASTKEIPIAPESLGALAKKSTLYQGEGSLKALTPAVAQQYREFAEANTSDPRLRQFKRKVAEEFLTQGQPLKAVDKAYFTNELIVNRSCNVALMCTSVRELRGKISSSEHDQLLRQANTLLDQYETHFKKQLADDEIRPMETYRDRVQKALDIHGEELILDMIQKNRQRLGSE